MTSINTLYKKTDLTMDELRHQREVLMTKRMQLIERHRKLSNRILIKPFLQSAQPPTPPDPKKSKFYDHVWIANLITGLVYDAVREVEVSRPNREKIRFYTALSDEYENLVDTIISKSIKQNVSMEMFEELCRDVFQKEMSAIVNQCIGEIDIAQTFTSSLILQSIMRTNEKINSLNSDTLNGDLIARNLMTEIFYERNKRKSNRAFHKLQLQPLKLPVAHAEKDRETEILQENVELFEGTVLSNPKTFDIQCLERLYLPPLFEKFSSSEIGIWKHIESELESPSQNGVMLAFAVSPTKQFCVVSVKDYILVINSIENSLISKTFVESKFGDCTHLCWLHNELEIIATTSMGHVCLWSFLGIDVEISDVHPKKQSKHANNVKSMKLIWSFNGVDLRLSQGPFAQPVDDLSIRHFPVQTYAAPLYTGSGEQSVFLVVCQNNEILRVCIESEDSILQPGDIPTFEEIKNVADCGVRFDICRGHTSKVIKLFIKDEYTFYSFDEQCYIIKWEYSQDCFDAYGLVIAHKYLIKGNGVDFVRLVKGQVIHFDKKGAKTRQEAMQAAKAAEMYFSMLGYGQKPQSIRENSEGGLIEKLFSKSVCDFTDSNVTGTVVITKIIGRSLISMKSRSLKLKNCRPSKLLGISISPCNTLIAYCFLFSNPLYGVKPYISISLLRMSDLMFLRNKIKIPLSSDLMDVLQDLENFTCCLTPPHFLTKVMYVILKIGKSMMMVSSATSNIVRTTLDLHKMSADNLKFFSEKNVATILGSKLFCDVLGEHLILYGSSSKEVVAFSTKPPLESEQSDLYYKQHGRWKYLTSTIDPDQKRLLVKSSIFWGKINETDYQGILNYNFIKRIAKEVVSSALDGLESK